MNKTFKTVFVGVAVSLAAFRLTASDSWYDAAQQVSWGFTVENGEATISTPGFWDSNARDKCTGDIVVPSRIGPDGPNGAKTYPVHDMAPGLFRNCTKVTSVTLPDGIRRVAPNAFYFDRDSIITNVVIGEGCLDICENAFLRCEKLVSLNIPNTVTNIGANAIQLCKILTRIDIPCSVKTIGDSAFAACYDLADVTFGDGIEIIDADAFMNCSSLLAADLPASVRSIGDRAFYGCNTLASATLREGLEAIGYYAFNQCESLVSVSIPESVTWVGERAFQYCPDSIFDKTTVPGVCLLSGWAVGVDNPFGAIDLFGVNGVADGLFKDCRDVTSVVLPPGIETLGGAMFSGCRSLESVSLPSVLKSIESYAFQSCQKIQAVNIPSGVTNIGQLAFGYCEKLAAVALPDGLAVMGDNAFEGCTNLTSVTIPASLKRIPMGAFENCTGLTNVTVEEGVEVIGNASFYGCRALPAFTIPDSVTVVEDIAFGGCEFLDTNTIANVEMVDGWIVGSNQPNLTEVTVPGDVRGISECAFSYRNNLTNAVVEDGVAALPFQAFAFDAKLTDVSLPASLVEIGKQVFCGCRGLVEAYVPSNVVAIGDEAFASCTTLEKVYLPIALKGKVNEASLISGSFNAKILYYRADGSIDDEKRVTFDPNGGELADADASRNVKEGAAVGVLPTPVWTKHKFLGWFTEREWGDKVAATTEIADTVTFYAHWEYTGLAELTVKVADGQEDLGSVTGGGSYPAGKVVALKAAVKNKSFFLGWFVGGSDEAASTALSWKYTMTDEDVTITAKFASAKDDMDSIKLAVNGMSCESAEMPIHTNVTCGTALAWPVAASALSGAAVKVAGLPAGLKFTAKDIFRKGSKTEVEIPANTIYGAPKAASKVDKNKGVVPSEVKITVTTAGKSSVTYILKLTVDPLPAWAMGNFEGYVSATRDGSPCHGVAAMSVTAAGKISGKIASCGTNWTFKADSFASGSVATNLAVDAIATAGKESRRFQLNVTSFPTEYIPDSATARAEGGLGDMSATLFRLPWTDKGDADVKSYLAAYVGTYTCKVPYGQDDEGEAKFTLDEKGVAKGSVVLPDSTKTRKVSLSASALTYAGSIYIAIYAPPDARKRYPAVFDLRQLCERSGPDDGAIVYRDPGVLVTTEERNKNSGASGTVTMNPKYGQAAAGKDVSLTAKAASGSVFSCWVVAGADTTGLDLTSPTIKLKANGTSDIYATATFVTTAEDQEEIMLIVDRSSLYGEVNDPGESNVAKRVHCGVVVDWAVRAHAYSQTTIKAEKLPNGLKLVQDKSTKAYSVVGVPTKAGTFATRFTATTAGKSKETVLLPIEVTAMPAECVGSYSGMAGGFEDMADDDTWRAFGMVTLSVAANGKLSAKAMLPSGTISFSANGWDSESNGFYRVEMSTKAGDRLFLKLDSNRDWRGARIEAPDSVLETAKGAAHLVVAWRNEHGKTGNITTDKTASDFIAKIATLKKLCFKVTGNVESGYTVKQVDATDKTANLTLTFDAKGNVKYSGKVGGKAIGGMSVLNVDGSDYYTIGDLVVPLSKTEALYLALGFDRENNEPVPGLDVFHVTE